MTTILESGLFMTNEDPEESFETNGNYRFTQKELLALKAVFRGCNTNGKLVGSTYVYKFGTEEEESISYYDALTIIDGMIETETLRRKDMNT